MHCHFGSRFVKKIDIRDFSRFLFDTRFRNYKARHPTKHCGCQKSSPQNYPKLPHSAHNFRKRRMHHKEHLSTASMTADSSATPTGTTTTTTTTTTSTTAVVEPDQESTHTMPARESVSRGKEEMAKTLLSLGIECRRPHHRQAETSYKRRRTLGGGSGSRPVREIVIPRNDRPIAAISDDDDDYNSLTDYTHDAQDDCSKISSNKGKNKRQWWTMQSSDAELFLPHIPAGRPLPPAPCLPRLSPGENVVTTKRYAANGIRGC